MCKSIYIYINRKEKTIAHMCYIFSYGISVFVVEVGKVKFNEVYTLKETRQ